MKKIVTLAVASILSVSAHQAVADFVGVSRCTQNDGTGNFVPGLMIVRGGERVFVPVGQDGLTQDIVYDESSALQWARAVVDAPEGSSFGDYFQFICGLLVEDSPPQFAGDETPPQEEPPQEEPPQETPEESLEELR